MRKWMQDRLLKRRKKGEPKTAAVDAPAPLQPAYQDAVVPAATPVLPLEREAPDDLASDPAPPSSEAVDDAAGNRVDSPDRSRRRRRGRRGGRGGRSRSATSGAPAENVPRQEPLRPTLMRPVETADRIREVEPVTVPPRVPAPPAQPKVPQGVVVLAIGLPGSGKSTWFKRHNIQPLSSDLLRGLLFDNPDEQRFQDLVFSNLRSMLRARLIARRPMSYVDATNLTPQERQSWIKLAHDHAYEVHALHFDVPLEACLERNRKRNRTVGDEVMRRMAAKFRPPTFEEGFTKIKVVRVKKRDDQPADV
jgi:predicted kinase